MPDTLIPGSLATLRQTIETLALELALRDLTSLEEIQPLSVMLGQIAGEAEAAGIAAVAETAGFVSRQIVEAPPQGEASLERALRDAISRMQQLVADPESKTEQPPAQLPLNQDPELIGDFVMESREHLSAIENQLLALEHDPGNAEAINTIFRGFHTIKGLAGFLEFPAIQQFAHEVETLLDLARNARMSVDSSLIDIILHSADYMTQCMRGVEVSLENNKFEPIPGAEPLIARIRAKIAGSAESASEEAAIQITNLANPFTASPADGATESARGRSANQQPASSGPRSVKVDTAKLDYLVDMVGELVIAQSLIRHDPDLAAARSPRLTRNLTQLSRITADVQKVAMAMRMIPVGQMFQRMARLVRDLARKSGKLADLELSGEDTELDRNMVEELADPLMHMIRNAVDHGAEPPKTRIAAGKNPTATLHLNAYHQGGFINIEVSDDGRGLSRERILTKARHMGLAAGGDQLTDQEVFSFIFEPGFSTADQVTDVSGRGVGMDVVRKQIMKLRGRVEISSTEGQGVTFLIKLPLTLAIIEGLVVGVGPERYIIPLFTIKEMFRPTAESLSSLPDGSEMVLVRGKVLPILRLHRRFGVTPKSENATEGILIVAENERKHFCILVDTLIGKQEVVIKSLGETFKNVTGITGGSILGDGRVGLILDVEALCGNSSRE